MATASVCSGTEGWGAPEIDRVEYKWCIVVISHDPGGGNEFELLDADGKPLAGKTSPAAWIEVGNAGPGQRVLACKYVCVYYFPGRPLARLVAVSPTGTTHEAYDLASATRLAAALKQNEPLCVLLVPQ